VRRARSNPLHVGSEWVPGTGWAHPAGVGLRRGRRDPRRLHVGDDLDWWRVGQLDRPRMLRLRAEMRLPGRAGLELSTQPAATAGPATGSRAVRRVVRLGVNPPRSKADRGGCCNSLAKQLLQIVQGGLSINAGQFGLLWQPDRGANFGWEPFLVIREDDQGSPWRHVP
jgi:hypothetical protein